MTRGINVGESGVELAESPVEERKKGIKDFHVTRGILEKFGMQAGCAGCDASLEGARRRHVPSCRERLENSMKEDDNVRERLRERYVRMNRSKTGEERVEIAEPVATELKS